MKGTVVVLMDVEVPSTYLSEDGTLPWTLEDDLASWLNSAMSDAHRKLLATFGEAAMLDNAEVWTLSAFIENGGRLTEDHPDVPEGDF